MTPPTETGQMETRFGYLRRTGPALAELFDKNTGEVYQINFAALADQSVATMLNGREWADEFFSPNPPTGKPCTPNTT